ncbi:hypothetical protein QFZ32_000114 [Streptomyces canus]|nr:hypothetical protein [Streptomyces canus]
MIRAGVPVPRATGRRAAGSRLAGRVPGPSRTHPGSGPAGYAIFVAEMTAWTGMTSGGISEASLVTAFVTLNPLSSSQR